MHSDVFCVLFVCKCVLPPGDNPIAVNKYIIIYQLFYKLSHSYIFDTIVSSSGGLVISTLTSYTIISNAAVCNTIYN